MTPRERVKLTLEHKKTDRIPLDLGGTASSMVDNEYFKLKEYLNLEGDIEPFRVGSNTTYYDERILDKLDIDFRRLTLKSSNKYPIYNEDGSFTNEWGITKKKSGMYINIINKPLENAELGDLEHYNWPVASEVFDVRGLKEHAKKLYNDTEYALVARMPCNGLFEIASWLRGMEQFMVDMMIDPDFAIALIKKIYEVQLSFYKLLLDEVSPFVQIVETGDDYGSQENLLFSPEIFNNIIKPYRKKLNEFIKLNSNNAKIFLHSCGAIYDIIPQLIESGVDILNPIQPLAKNMNALNLKNTFGNKLCFHGGLDTQVALKGSITDVETEVKNKIDILSDGGGYIFAPSNHMQEDIPVENIVRMYELAKEYSLFINSKK